MVDDSPFNDHGHDEALFTEPEGVEARSWVGNFLFLAVIIVIAGLYFYATHVDKSLYDSLELATLKATLRNPVTPPSRGAEVPTNQIGRYSVHLHNAEAPTLGVPAYMMCWDGQTWDRCQLSNDIPAP